MQFLDPASVQCLAAACNAWLQPCGLTAVPGAPPATASPRLLQPLLHTLMSDVAEIARQYDADKYGPCSFGAVVDRLLSTFRYRALLTAAAAAAAASCAPELELEAGGVRAEGPVTAEAVAASLRAHLRCIGVWNGSTLYELPLCEFDSVDEPSPVALAHTHTAASGSPADSDTELPPSTISSSGRSSRADIAFSGGSSAAGDYPGPHGVPLPRCVPMPVAATTSSSSGMHVAQQWAGMGRVVSALALEAGLCTPDAAPSSLQGAAATPAPHPAACVSPSGPSGSMRLYLNTRVTHIDVSQCEHITVTTASNDDAAPRQFRGRHVICTLPIALLQQSLDDDAEAESGVPAPDRLPLTFSPRLPSWKRDAFSAVRLCQYKKVFLSFPSVWWKELPPFWLPQSDAADAAAAPMFAVIENYAVIKGNGKPVLAGILVGSDIYRPTAASAATEEAAPVAPADGWEIFADMQVGPARRATFAAMMRDAAAHHAATTAAASSRSRSRSGADEVWSDAECVSGLLAQLQHMFPHIAATATGTVPAPLATYVTAWESDAHTGGGAYAAASHDCSEAACDALAAPLASGTGHRLTGDDAVTHTGAILHWAGEATDAEHMGSTHAAFLTGERAAAAVLAAHRAAASSTASASVSTC